MSISSTPNRHKEVRSLWKTVDYFYQALSLLAISYQTKDIQFEDVTCAFQAFRNIENVQRNFVN